MDPLAGLTIATYARFSSDNQRDTSIDDQLRLAREYVERQDGRLSDEFILTDYAVSGASRARAGFERLLGLIENRKINVVVTESASRLSRDLGDADRLWKLCEFFGVRLVCISEGVDSARDGSRMQFQLNAFMSDQYLVKLGKETYRGLRGAAERGHSTGGLPYGYTSKAIWNGGREPEGYEILVHPDQAPIVVRIFELYLDGKSIRTIAKTFNDEGIPAPRATSRKKPTEFWRKNTVREMLRNQAYVGKWSFGRKKWRKDPRTGKRRYVKRAPNDVHDDDRPHLRLVPQDLWEAVQARIAAVHENISGRGHGASGRPIHHPFSGVLFCGKCGHRMTDSGGSTSRYYRCSAFKDGGICGNTLPIREDQLVEIAVTELKRIFTETSLYDEMKDIIRQRLKSFRVKAHSDRKDWERDLARAEAEITRLVAFISSTDPSASPGAFEAVRVSLEKATTNRDMIKNRLASLTESVVEPRMPAVEEIVGFVLDVEARLRDDPTSAREALRRALLDGKLVMHPQPDGSYLADSMLLPLRLGPRTRKPRLGSPSGASDVVANACCAGMQLDFPAQQIQGVAEVWVPFDDVIAVGWA